MDRPADAPLLSYSARQPARLGRRVRWWLLAGVLLCVGLLVLPFGWAELKYRLVDLPAIKPLLNVQIPQGTLVYDAAVHLYRPLLVPTDRDRLWPLRVGADEVQVFAGPLPASGRSVPGVLLVTIEPSSLARGTLTVNCYTFHAGRPLSWASEEFFEVPLSFPRHKPVQVYANGLVEGETGRASFQLETDAELLQLDLLLAPGGAVRVEPRRNHPQIGQRDTTPDR